jgi:hypothetical protein
MPLGGPPPVDAILKVGYFIIDTRMTRVNQFSIT